MKKAFTLIELLVVMTILTVVIGLVMPKGSKMLSGFQKSIKNIEDKQKLSKARSMAFIQAKEKNLKILGISYHISVKGVLSPYEESNDNN